MRRFRGDAAAYAAIVQRLDNALETEFHAELTRRPYRSLQHAPAMRLFDGWVEIGECTLLNPESGSSIAFVAVPFQFGRNCCRLSPLSSCSQQSTQENDMNKDHVKGAVEKAKGSVKDAAGGLTGDSKLQAEGKLDKAKGAVHKAVGDAKDAVKKAVDD
jgi:uncharacterized protein YjbJ (UPF0337 family)